MNLEKEEDGPGSGIQGEKAAKGRKGFWVPEPEAKNVIEPFSVLVCPLGNT